MSRAMAWRCKNISVYVGVAAYLAMLITGDVALGAIGKLTAELLRIPYFRQTDALDMVRLSYFFICSSVIALFLRFL